MVMMKKEFVGGADLRTGLDMVRVRMETLHDNLF
jgi:hypothetical protein